MARTTHRDQGKPRPGGRAPTPGPTEYWAAHWRHIASAPDLARPQRIVRVVGYSYDADVHCVNCAIARFGADGYGWVPAATDSEGNPVGAMYANSESDHPESCAECQAPLGTALTSVGALYVRAVIHTEKGDIQYAYLFTGDVDDDEVGTGDLDD